MCTSVRPLAPRELPMPRDRTEVCRWHPRPAPVDRDWCQRSSERGEISCRRHLRPRSRVNHRQARILRAHLQKRLRCHRMGRDTPRHRVPAWRDRDGNRSRGSVLLDGRQYMLPCRHEIVVPVQGSCLSPAAVSRQGNAGPCCQNRSFALPTLADHEGFTSASRVHRR